MNPTIEGHIASLAISAHPVATLVVDLDGTVLFSNHAARTAFGFATPADPTSNNIADWKLRRGPLFELLESASVSSNWIPAVLLHNEIALHVRARGLRADATSKPTVLITSVPDATTPFVEHARQIKRLNSQLAIYQQTAKELRQALSAAQTLKRELVHRVKNNLAIISALLNMQASSAKSTLVSEELRSAASRIASIASVHEILDVTNQTDHVDLADLMTRITAEFRRSICPPNIRIDSKIESFVAHIDVALPLALLVNELVTNAIKHAFVDRPSGSIRITCSIVSGAVEIRVADDGIGISADHNGNMRTPRIVSALTEQIEGTIDCHVAQGTVWILRFSIDPRNQLSAAV